MDYFLHRLCPRLLAFGLAVGLALLLAVPTLAQTATVIDEDPGGQVELKDELEEEWDDDDDWGSDDDPGDDEAEADWEDEGTVYDPWEGWNRKMFAFNEFGDKYVVKPLSIAYDFVTPAPLDAGITNAYYNIREPITIINGLLQGKWRQAGADTGRLLINSTLGLAGLFDVASKLGLERHVEDFGQTLGHWGVKPGPYLVLPILGPSGLRDGIGLVPDAFSNPLTYIGDFPTRAGTISGYYIDKRADLLDTEELITGDRYVFLRDTYLQNREYLVEDGEVEDDFGDEDF